MPRKPRFIITGVPVHVVTVVRISASVVERSPVIAIKSRECSANSSRYHKSL
jgi:hypothetical protein